jgi:hypothetical protein
MQGPLTVPARHVISIPGDPTVTDAILSRDGSQVFVATIFDTVHVGRLLDLIVPYLIGVVCIWIIYNGVERIVKAIRTPREVNKRYCPKCNYCVTHDTGELKTCAECGLNLARTPAVVGLSVRHRVLRALLTRIAPASVMLIAFLACVMTIGVFRHLPWYSTSLADKLIERGIVDQWWLGMGLSQRIWRIDTESGTMTPSRILPGCTFADLVIDPNHDRLFMEWGLDIASAVDIATLQRISGLQVADQNKVMDSPVIVGLVGGTNDVALVQWSDWNTDVTTLARWSMTGNAATPLTTLAPYTATNGMTWSRSFITTADDARRVLLAQPSFSEAFDSTRFLIHVFETSLGATDVKQGAVVDLGTDIDPDAACIISLRHDALLVTARDDTGAWIRAYDLSALLAGTANIRWSLQVPQDGRVTLELSPDESVVYVPTIGGIAEIDMTTPGVRRVLLSDRTSPNPIDARAGTVMMLTSRQVSTTSPNSRFTADVTIWSVR